MRPFRFTVTASVGHCALGFEPSYPPHRTLPFHPVAADVGEDPDAAPAHGAWTARRTPNPGADPTRRRSANRPPGARSICLPAGASCPADEAPRSVRRTFHRRRLESARIWHRLCATRSAKAAAIPMARDSREPEGRSGARLGDNSRRRSPLGGSDARIGDAPLVGGFGVRFCIDDDAERGASAHNRIGYAGHNTPD
jgi:hypothetical protein